MSGYNLGMTTATIKFKPEVLIGKINELEKVLLPKAATDSLHKAVFEATRELSSAAGTKFRNTVPFTLKSFLYRKPTPIADGIEAAVFIREDGPKGNAPADYLSPQIQGGLVYRTRFQRRLEAKGFLGGMQDAYMMPALQGSKLKKGEYTKALWGIKAFEDFRAPTDRGRGYRSLGDYVWVPPDLATQIGAEAHANKVRRLNRNGVGTTVPGQIPKAGIYKVLKSGLRQKFISLPYVPSGYVPKFDFENIAKNSIKRTFKEELTKNLKR